MKSTFAVILIVRIVAGAADAMLAAESDPRREPKTAEAATAALGETDATTTEAAPLEARAAGTGAAAMEKAGKAKKYLFALFRNEESDQTAAMRKVVKEAVKKVADRADSVEIDVTAASEKAVVDQFRLGGAPMPLLLAIAPNGAITAGFATTVEERDLLEAFATPCTEKCMKALQDRKLVFVCIQNSKTKSNSEAMQGIRDFKQGSLLGDDTEIVMVDPADAAEADLLKHLQIDPKPQEAITIFLAPPGIQVGQYEGATNADALLAALQMAMSGCGCGCGPGGCAPR